MSFLINDLAEALFTKERPVGIVLDPQVVIQQAVNAARFYAAYGSIESVVGKEAEQGIDATDPASPIFNALPVPAAAWLSASTELTQHEWGIIKPLFLLYVERENALYLEASRSMGVDVYGRSASEIQGDINQYEMTLPSLAFFQPIITI